MSPILGARLPQADPRERPAEKVPLYLQVKHVEDELQKLKSNECAGTSRLKPSPGEAQLLAKRQAAVVETMRWFKEHEADLREWVEARRASRKAAELGSRPA